MKLSVFAELTKLYKILFISLFPGYSKVRNFL